MISFDENDLFKNGRGEEDDTVSLAPLLSSSKLLKTEKLRWATGLVFFLICVSCWCNINLETNSLN